MSRKEGKNLEARRGKRIELRVTEEEFSAINTRCKKAEVTRSAYLIQSVLSEKVLTNIDAQVIFQLRKIGNNLNQITKQVHIISKFVDAKEKHLPEILKTLSSMNEQLESITHFILKDHAGKN